jgi:hypothetical protein
MAEQFSSQQRQAAIDALPKGAGRLEVPRQNPTAHRLAAAFTGALILAANPSIAQNNPTEPPAVTTTTTSPVPSYDPAAPMDPREYSRFIQGLNQDIDASAFKGKTRVVDLSRTPDIESIVAELNVFAAGKPQKTQDSLFLNVASLAMVPPEELQMRTLASGPIAASDPGFASMALPARPIETARTLFSASFENAGITPGKDWQSKLNTPFGQRVIAAHEVYHGLLGLPAEKGETPYARIKRTEIGADVFGILYLAQRQEPDLDRQLQGYATFREANVGVSSLNTGLAHDSSDALRQLAKDLPTLRADPDFAKKSLSDLVTLADGYAKGSMRKDFPHLYAPNKLSDAQALQQTETIENKFIAVAEYAINRSHGIRDEKAPSHLDAAQAALLLRTSRALNNVAGNSDNKLATGVQELRTKHPQAFKDADAIVGVEAGSLAQQNRKQARSRSMAPSA